MARRYRHEDQENHDRWLVSYADFITLLFAFFVVMYAISSVNEGKYRVLSKSLTAIFHQSPRSMNPIQLEGLKSPLQSSPIKIMESSEDSTPVQTPGILPYPFPAQEGVGIASIETLTKEIETAFLSLIEEDLVRLRQGQEWLEVEINDSVLFASGSAQLESEAVPVLQKLAKTLRRFSNPIQVEGFTDNVPISTSVFPSNWELSSARAASVVHLLDRYGIAPSRMAAIGYGEYRPIADNSTPEGRRQNRRVVLVILGKPYSRRTLEAQVVPSGWARARDGGNNNAFPPSQQSDHKDRQLSKEKE